MGKRLNSTLKYFILFSFLLQALSFDIYAVRGTRGNKKAQTHRRDPRELFALKCPICLTNGFIKCPNCNKTSHRQCIEQSINHRNYACPWCRKPLRKLNKKTQQLELSDLTDEELYKKTQEEMQGKIFQKDKMLISNLEELLFDDDSDDSIIIFRDTLEWKLNTLIEQNKKTLNRKK